MSWKQQPVPAPLIDGVEDIANSADSIASALDALLGTASGLLDVAKAFFSSSVDPYKAIAEAIISELEDLINDTFATGAYTLVVRPDQVKGIRQYDFITGIPLMTPKRAINEMSRSFDDMGDDERPQFSDSATVSGFGFMITAPDLDQFVSIMEGFLAVFEIDSFKKWLENLKRKSNYPSGTPITTTPRPPDWKSWKLNDIDFLRQQQQELNKLLNTFKGYLQTADNSINDLLNIIERKLNTLKNLVQSLRNLIQEIKNAVDASGIYVLDIPTAVGGNSYLKDQLRDQKLESLRVNGYTASVIFIGGGPSLQPIETIKSLIT